MANKDKDDKPDKAKIARDIEQLRNRSYALYGPSLKSFGWSDKRIKDHIDKLIDDEVKRIERDG